MKASKRYHKLGKTRFYAIFGQSENSAVSLTYVEEIIRHRHQDIPGTDHDIDNTVLVGFPTRRQRDRAVEAILNGFNKMSGTGTAFKGLPSLELKQLAEYCWEHYSYVLFPITFEYVETYTPNLESLLTKWIDYMIEAETKTEEQDEYVCTDTRPNL